MKNHGLNVLLEYLIYTDMFMYFILIILSEGIEIYTGTPALCWHGIYMFNDL